MSVHLSREMDLLKRQMLEVSARVQESVRNAVKSLVERDELLASRVIDADEKIDDMEVRVEEEGLKILALHQPVASDLRMILAVVKINNDLERIGDLAVNIAERSRFLAAHPRPRVDFDFGEMARITQEMLSESLDAIVGQDVELASRVRLRDDEVDAMNRDMYRIVEEGIQRDPGQTKAYLHLLSVSRHLERIADLASNISEDVIYMVDGKIVRHQPEDYRSEG